MAKFLDEHGVKTLWAGIKKYVNTEDDTIKDVVRKYHSQHHLGITISNSDVSNSGNPSSFTDTTTGDTTIYLRRFDTDPFDGSNAISTEKDTNYLNVSITINSIVPSTGKVSAERLDSEESLEVGSDEIYNGYYWKIKVPSTVYSFNISTRVNSRNLVTGSYCRKPGIFVKGTSTTDIPDYNTFEKNLTHSGLDVAGTYNVTTTEDSYIWFCIPPQYNKTSLKVTSGGFEVPIVLAYSTSANPSGYMCYRTANKILKGTSTFNLV